MRPLSVATVSVDETPRVTLPEPVLSPWLTYPGDQRAGFPADQLYQGDNGVGWMPYEAEVDVTGDGSEITHTRVRFQMVWNNGVSIYVDPDTAPVAEGGGHTVKIDHG